VSLTNNSLVPVGAVVKTSATAKVTITVNVARGANSSLAQETISLGPVTIVGPSRRYPRALSMRLPPRPRGSCRQAVVAAARKRKKRTTTVRVRNSYGPVKVVTHDVPLSSEATSWTTTQSCAGTSVRVTTGVVVATVRDHGQRKKVRIIPGRTFFFRRQGR
jgi:hypothetical protein